MNYKLKRRRRDVLLPFIREQFASNRRNFMTKGLTDGAQPWDMTRQLREIDKVRQLTHLVESFTSTGKSPVNECLRNFFSCRWKSSSL